MDAQTAPLCWLAFVIWEEGADSSDWPVRKSSGGISLTGE